MMGVRPEDEALSRPDFERLPLLANVQAALRDGEQHEYFDISPIGMLVAGRAACEAACDIVQHRRHSEMK
ncbi:hypothetical protein D3C87_2094950 [compost metagenome]